MRKLGQAGKPAGGFSGPAVDDDDEPPADFDPDALLPRTDISNQISTKLVANLSSANWKERNAALDEVEEIIKSAGGRIQPTVGDLMPALKVSTNTCMASRAGLIDLTEDARSMQFEDLSIDSLLQRCNAECQARAGSLAAIACKFDCCRPRVV